MIILTNDNALKRGAFFVFLNNGMDGEGDGRNANRKGKGMGEEWVVVTYGFRY